MSACPTGLAVAAQIKSDESISGERALDLPPERRHGAGRGGAAGQPRRPRRRRSPRHGPARSLPWAFAPAPSLEYKNSILPCFANSIQSVSWFAFAIELPRQLQICNTDRVLLWIPRQHIDNDCIIHPLDKYKQDTVRLCGENRFFRIKPKRPCCSIACSR